MLFGLRLALLAMVFAGFISAPLAAVGATASAAPPAPSLRSTEWRVACDNNGKALDCQVNNQVIQPNGQPVASIAVHPLAGGKTIAVVQLPLGIGFSAPVELSVDARPAVILTLDTCVAQGCIASGVLTDGFLADAEKGTKLTLAFGLGGRNVTMGVPLQGFGLGYGFITRK